MDRFVAFILALGLASCSPSASQLEVGLRPGQAGLLRSFGVVLGSASYETASDASVLTQTLAGANIYLQTSASGGVKLTPGAHVLFEDRGDGLAGVWTFPAVTQLFASPLDFSSGWTLFGGATVPLTNVADPFGGTNSCQLRDPTAASVSAVFQVPAGGSYCGSIWTRDHAGDAPTAPGMLSYSTTAFLGLPIGTQATYTRNRLFVNASQPGAANGIYAIWITGNSPGNIQVPAAVGSRDTFGPMLSVGATDYPFCDGNLSASDAQLPGSQVSQLIAPSGDLDLSFTVAPPILEGDAVPSGWMYSISTPDGVIGVERDTSTDTWKFHLRGATVLTMPQTSSLPNGNTQGLDGQDLTARVWYHSSTGAVGFRLTVNGATAYDQTGTTTSGALAQPTAMRVGSNLGASGFWPTRARRWQSRIANAPTDYVPEGLVLGDSTIASFLACTMVSSWVYTVPEAQARAGIRSLAIPGDTIAGQRAQFDAYSHSAAVRWVVIQVGLNDVNNVAGSSAAVITAYQSLVNHVRAVNPTCSILVATMTPANLRWENAFGAPATNAKNNWAAINQAISGAGGTPITGVDARITSQTAALDRNPLVPTGYLSNGTSDGTTPSNTAGFYDLGDGIHENDVGRRIIGSAWRTGLVSLGLL